MPGWPSTSLSPPPKQPTRYRFRPRFKLLAFLALAVGGALLIASLAFGLPGSSRLFALVSGIAGLILGGLYLVSPSWSIEVVLDDEALEVLSKGERRFRLPYSEVVKVVAAPGHATCFVDGGAPEKSLLVPGQGAPAPYEIERSDELVREILARVPAEVVEKVESLEEYRKSAAQK